MPIDMEMPAGGAEAGESAWAAAEKMATAHEAELVASGKPVPGGDAGAIQESTREEEPEKPAAKPVRQSKPDGGDKSAKLKQLEALAAEVGMKIDGNRVEVAERVALRNERRQMREAAERELSTGRARLAEEQAKIGGSSAKYSAFEKAQEAGDFDGMAKAAGFPDWKGLVAEHTKRLASPEYREIQELKRRDAEREERDRKMGEERQLMERRAKEHTDIQAYKSAMADELKGFDGQLARMADDSDAVDLLYQVRAEHYRATGEELDLAETAETPARCLGGKSLLDLLQAKWESLNAIFGDHPASKDEVSSETTRRSGQSPRSRERKPPKTVSQRNAAEASAPPEFKDDAEFKRYFTGLLNQSTHTTG